jgi:hypothetical protein
MALSYVHEHNSDQKRYPRSAGEQVANLLRQEIVLSRIPQTQRNTMWQLFSSVLEKFDYAKTHHKWRNSELSSIINQLYPAERGHYCAEGVFMSYTVEDYLRETRQQVLNSLTLEEILRSIGVQDLSWTAQNKFWTPINNILY